MVRKQIRRALICLLIGLAVSVLSLAQDGSDDTTTWPAELTIRLEADGSGDYPTLEEAVKQAPSGATIRLGPGSYQLEQSLKIYKSLRMIGAGMDQTGIISAIEEYVVYFAGEGPFVAEGITFRHLGDKPADVVTVLGGEASFFGCRFSGGVAEDYSGGMGLKLEKETVGVIKDCEARDNDYNGIYVTHRAEPTLEKNLSINNGWSGIAYVNSSAGLALQNECIANKNAGIWVGQDAHPTIEKNICAYNDGSGINYYDNAYGLARQNECSWNEYHGIAISDEAKPTLVANLAMNNADSGIAYFDNALGVARHNKCSKNVWYGIYVGEEANPVLEKNVCTDNTTGIYIGGNARGLVHGNECKNNEVGIYIEEAASPDLVENRFYANTKQDVNDQRPLITEEDKAKEEIPVEKYFYFEDDFTNPASGWTTTETEIVRKGYENGQYSIVTKKANHFEWTLFPVAGIPRIFFLELEAQKIGDSEGVYGILFGFKDQGKYYLYLVDSSGNYKLERVVDGKAATRINWKYSYALEKGNKSNRLKIVIDKASNVKLYANDELIHTVIMEPYYEGGSVALYTQSYTEDFYVKFDYVKLRAFELCQ